MALIDKIKKRHAKVRRSIEVPEWGATLYFGPLTPNDMEAAVARMRDEGLDPAMHETHKRVTLLFLKAEDEEGNSVFEFGHRVEFMEKVEWAVLQRVVAFMYAASFSDDPVIDLESAKKKSKKTRGSSASSSPESS